MIIEVLLKHVLPPLALSSWSKIHNGKMFDYSKYVECSGKSLVA